MNDNNISFSKRLTQALDLRNFPPIGNGRASALQELFGLSRAGANKWLHGKAFPHKAKRLEISQKLGVNLHWLETGNGQPLDHDPLQFQVDSLIRSIPLITMEQVYWLPKTLEEKKYETMIVNSDMPLSIFAVKFAGDSMFPKFTDGSILIIDSNQSIQDGDFVLAKTNIIPEAI